MAAGIGNIYIKDTCISITCIISTWIKYAGIKNTFTKVIYIRYAYFGGVKPRVLAELIVTLTDLWVRLIDLSINEYCLWLFIKLIFT